jgi:hypothetical protein
LERPALQALLGDIRARKIDVVVVYKVDRLTRSLADFAKLVELFEAHGVSFVSVTQQFNTTTSMGRLTLNVLLSFAQFEREIAGERELGTSLHASPHIKWQKELDFSRCRCHLRAAWPYLDPAPLAMPPLWGFGGDGAGCRRNRKDRKCRRAKPTPRPSLRRPRATRKSLPRVAILRRP